MFRKFRYFCCNTAEVIDSSLDTLGIQKGQDELNNTPYKILSLLG